MSRLRLGTRGSKLALWQADFVIREIKRFYPDMEVETVVIKTAGDKILDVALSRIGDKGLFVKELEQALLDYKIDLAVHSMKDLPSVLTPELSIGAVMEREYPGDVFLSHKDVKISDLSVESKVGTSSLRRSAQLQAALPGLKVVDLRGNVETRLKKMQEQDLDGIVLAYAGVKRLGFIDYVTDYISFDLMLPAAAQGAIALEIRGADEKVAKYLQPLNQSDAFYTTMAERRFLSTLQGGCQVPIAALAEIADNQLVLRGLIASLDGRRIYKDTMSAELDEWAALGEKLACRLLAQGAGSILRELIS